MELIVRHKGTRVRFEVVGIIDEKGAEVLRQDFSKLDTGAISELVLDLGNVGYICSAGVGKLLMFYRELTENGGKLLVENDTGSVRELLVASKMDTILCSANN